MLPRKYARFAWATVLIVLISFPLFIHLDQLPIRIWDEARLAFNAIEMHENGNYIVTHYEGEPDMWNTKPPLMIWAQVAFIKLLGVNELALRMPAALAAFTTCLVLIFFTRKAFGQYSYGILAALVLVTTNGYVENHVSRSGDYDALLTLLTTSYCLCFFLYVHKGKVKYLHLFFIALTLAVLTKSIQALIFLPVIGLYTIYQRKLLQLLQNKWFYVNTLLFLFFACGYFLMRESQNPGYLQAVWENDLGGRYSNDLVDGNRDNWFYIKHIITYDISFWLIFILAGVVIGYRSTTTNLKAYVIYGGLLFTFYLLVISTAQTKLPWYLAPLFPLMSLLAAIGLQGIFNLLQRRYQPSLRLWAVPSLFLAAVFLYPYQHIIRKSYRPSEASWDKDLYRISYLLQDANRQPLPSYSFKNHYLCYEDYSTQIMFYIKVLNEKGQNIRYRSYEQIEPGDTIIAVEQQVKKRIEESYHNQVLYKYYNVVIYNILEEKEIDKGQPDNKVIATNQNITSVDGEVYSAQAD